VGDKKRKYYCDFVKCKSLGTCTIPMSGEDCYTLGILDKEAMEMYERWLKENKYNGNIR